jgi:AraC-like DNA-binding protein
MMSEKPVPIRLAKSMLRAVEAQGYIVEDVLLAASTDVDLLNRDDSETIDAELYNRLYRLIMDLLQDECFALHLNRKIPAGSFRMLCLCIIHCDNLRHAIARTNEFNQFCRLMLGLKHCNTSPLSVENDIATMVFAENPWLFGVKGEENIPAIIYTMSSWRRFTGWLIGGTIEPIEVLLRASEPQCTDSFNTVFACPILYDQPISGVRFAAYHLDAPLIQTEDSLEEFLRVAPFQLIARSDEENDNIVSRMRYTIGNDFSKDFPSITAMSDTLNMSVRTLRRRLKKEGLTFQQFKDNTRLQASETYLSRPELKINAVSALLGFDEPSAFHRSFKKWTGMTPGEFRSRRGLHVGHS